MRILSQIKDSLREWGDRSPFGSRVFQLCRSVVAHCLLILPDHAYAKWFYHQYTGLKLDLDNPRRFDEKIWWLKLNNRDPLLTTCSDKYAVRKYVAEHGCEETLIPQLGVYDNADLIPFEDFREEVIIKCTSGSGENVFYTPGRHASIPAIRKRLNSALKRNPYLFSREWNYKNIPNRIIVDKVIRDSGGNLPLDYKFMCFDGEPKLLFLDIGLFDDKQVYNHKYPRNIYDMDFNLMPFKETRDNYLGEVRKPDNWEYMIEVARKLSQPFPFVRCDLYNIDGKVYFGELTFYHGGGCNAITPEEWDYRLGSWIDINSPKIVRK